MAKEPSQNQKMPELLTLQEACDLLKVHPNTLRKWDAQGVLPAIRIGTKRVRRYRKDDLIKFLQSGK
ncbi:MAG TPA: helix-turn-helix domain-containing protein [Candidatus Paceibacterota bacterium]|nr:helix-turn-helix domain-containing protein [Candidatus Pacearchaeota archaeon]HRZ51325.1 helix-turn-helix domain-containing protein [Candidatus Paceibacterota bacterium]HSA37047.1 helix-turn-helix domain-containing protein [Candidatus Paceibacterota bacterium]